MFSKAHLPTPYPDVGVDLAILFLLLSCTFHLGSGLYRTPGPNPLNHSLTSSTSNFHPAPSQVLPSPQQGQAVHLPRCLNPASNCSRAVSMLLCRKLPSGHLRRFHGLFIGSRNSSAMSFPCTMRSQVCPHNVTWSRCGQVRSHFSLSRHIDSSTVIEHAVHIRNCSCRAISLNLTFILRFASLSSNCTSWNPSIVRSAIVKVTARNLIRFRWRGRSPLK